MKRLAGDRNAMSYNIRPLQDADLMEVCRLRRDADELFFMSPSASFPLHPDALRQSLIRREAPTVLVQHERVCGFANFYRWQQGGDCAIGNVIVAAHARGQGLASSLVSYMRELALSQYQARSLSIACFNTNAAALLLYTKLGFVPHAVEPRSGLAGERLALIHMQSRHVPLGHEA